MEINGKRYDAVSGKQILTAPTHVSTIKPGASIDGFRPARRSGGYASAATQPVVRRAPHAPAVHVSPHQPQRAQTLMRTAVKKPDIQSPQHLRAQTRTDILAHLPSATITPKASHLSIDPRRLKKASRMVQSPAVSRFNAHVAGNIPSSRLHSRPSAVDIQPSGIRPNPAPTPIPTIAVASARPHAPQADMFVQAMASATSHEQKYEGKARSKRRGRLSGVITAAMCLLLLAGIFAYYNAPVLSLRMASNRAGFSAKLPGYSPVGYSFGELSYGPGNITVSYRADDQRTYDITQRISDWDSQALLNNFVASANKAYQTYERAGRTVYFFGNNTATWVDNGVWYTVNGNNSLNKNQLLDLAGSI